LMKTGGRVVKHARYYWLLLAEGHLNRKLFGAMLGRIWAPHDPERSVDGPKQPAYAGCRGPARNRRCSRALGCRLNAMAGQYWKGGAARRGY
jgi:hypothetical protein